MTGAELDTYFGDVLMGTQPADAAEQAVRDLDAIRVMTLMSKRDGHDLAWMRECLGILGLDAAAAASYTERHGTPPPIREAPTPPAKPSRLSTRPIDHGTAAGYQQHRYRSEPPCDACKEGNRQATRDWRARLAELPRVRAVKRDRCGTTTGYRAHMNNGEKTCVPCREAKRLDSARRRAAAAGQTS